MDDETEAIKEEWKPRVVGRGLRAPFENPEDEQWYLADSEHPYAPFPGNALKWESFVYDDGTSFEGLAREFIPHGKGVMIFGNGTGAGIQLVQPGDKYEGEFFAGFANGLGSYTSASGEVYRGEWLYGKRHGCGAVTNFQPYFKELKKGTPPDEAWKKTRGTIASKRMRFGRWERNRFVKDIKDNSDDICHLTDIRGMLQEMESVVTKARMFQFKPDGDATHINLRDANGVPVPVFQDPMHYPHGTRFLAPGPVGQCYAIPDDANLKREMLKHARNYKRIYNQYNLPYFAKPGDDLFAAARLGQIEQLKAEHYRRIAAGEDEAAVMKDLNDRLQGLKKESVPPPAAEEQRRPQRQRPAPRMEPAAKAPPPPADDDSEIDEDDLVASTSGAEDGRLPPGASPTLFASMSGRSHRLTRAVHAVAASAAYRLPRVFRREPLGRQAR